MKSILLAKSGLNKLRAGHRELKVIDLEGSVRSHTPGEWCLFTHTSTQESWIGFVNPLIDEKFSCVHIVTIKNSSTGSNQTPESIITNLIDRSVQRRFSFKGYREGSRLFYGLADGLPGLIIDGFKNASIIQINTAGVDRYREVVKSAVTNAAKRPAFFLDNQKYREKEHLPVYTNDDIPALEIEEDGMRFEVRKEVLQKIGFYYDHRENRSQLKHILPKLSIPKERGVDLFSYAGAWGVSALLGGVSHVDFVDQGEFETEVEKSLSLNGQSAKGTFHRVDVFKFLDDSISKGAKFDVILCDPPAFAKSASQKDQALEGYSKLHRKVFKAASAKALVVFSSCTQYVGQEEFQKNILDAAMKEQKNVQLLHVGIQGWDHPIRTQSERGSYIKSFFYILE